MAIILARLINASVIYTPIISSDALQLALYYQMSVHYIEEVDYIVNRNKDGRCPIEASVLDTTDPDKGYQLIIEALNTLKKES